MTAILRCLRGYLFSGVGDVPFLLSIPLLSPFSFSGVMIGDAGLALAPGDALVDGLPAGAPLGEVAGELVAVGEPVAAGDEVAAGLGVTAGLFWVLVFASVHAPRNAAVAAKTVSRIDLLIF